MAGVPPSSSDLGAGRGRGMTLPSWMSGPNAPAPASGPPSANNFPSGFRPPLGGQPGNQFLHPTPQQFHAGSGPPQNMGPPYSQISQPNQPLQSGGAPNFSQQQRPSMVATSQPTGVLPQGNVGSNIPSGMGSGPHQFASSTPFSQPNFQQSHQQIQGVQSISQPWLGTPNQPNTTDTPPASQSNQLNSTPGSTANVTRTPPGSSSDWQEHSAPDGRRYYYNKKTKVSSWEKPLELMTPLERADASTVWKEFMSADGRKYYYNKLTKQSKWTMPEEMKLARERAESAASPASPQAPERPTVSPSPSKLATSSPVSAVPATVNSLQPTSVRPSGDSSSELPAATNIDSAAVILDSKSSSEKDSTKKDMMEEISPQDIEEAKRSMPSVGNVTASVEEKPVSVIEEQPTYANKTEAKNAFKELLEAVHVESDWTWEQAMRVIINDKRYGALKTLGERKQAFNEYLAQRKKQEAEEKRLKQKKAREEFVIMMQESKELTSAMRWSKAASLFTEDPRYHAVEKERERVELFEDYLIDLEKKEKEKAREDRKRYLSEYKAFLETCDFIKVNTQWRKVVDKLEDDERCTRLEKIDRLEVFQDHIRHLEKVEEEEKRTLKEQQRRRERKNRDEFRKLIADNRTSGILTARVTWKDYVSKIKDHPAYEALCTNLSGSTPKDLFDDFMEDVDKKYQEDKASLKDIIKAGKINVTSAWTYDMFKDAIMEGGDLTGIDECNIKIVFEDLLDRAKEKEEKEAKRKKRIVDDFIELLHGEKSITVASKWEDCKVFLEDTPQFRALTEDSERQELFEEHVALLQQKAKEKEKKREEEKAKKEKDKEEKEKEKEKEREIRKEKEKREREKEKDREKEKSLRKDRENHGDSSQKEREKSRRDKESNVLTSEKEKDKSSKKERDDAGDIGNLHLQKEERRKEKDRSREKEKDRKHRKSHRSRSSDDASSELEDKEEVKRSRKHSGDKRKSSRKHAYESNSDSESRHKRHRKDRHHKSSTADELEDGELGEDGEIQ